MMLDLANIKRKIKAIKSNKYYEGDFGDVIDGVDLILSNVADERIKDEFPDDYLNFIQLVGFGELDASFYINDGPFYYTETYKREIEGLNGMYLFANDGGEYSFAFDTENNWKIVDIDSSGEVKNIVAPNFSEFIDGKLDELLGIVKWRNENY